MWSGIGAMTARCTGNADACLPPVRHRVETEVPKVIWTDVGQRHTQQGHRRVHSANAHN